MASDKTVGIARLGLGLLIAPAILPVSIGGVLAVAARDTDVNCPVLGPMLLCGIAALSYACAAVFGLPWVLWMRKRGELCLRTIMAPVLGLALPLLALLAGVGAMVSWSLGGIVALSVPGIVLSALCFYFIVVWRSVAIPLE